MARELFAGIFATNDPIYVQLTSAALTSLGQPSNAGPIQVQMCQLMEGGQWIAFWYTSGNTTTRYVFPPQAVVYVTQPGS